MLVDVSLAVKLISSEPILISPEVGKEAELVKGISVVDALIPAERVVVAGPWTVTQYSPVPQPLPLTC